MKSLGERKIMIFREVERPARKVQSLVGSHGSLWFSVTTGFCNYSLGLDLLNLNSFRGRLALRRFGP